MDFKIPISRRDFFKLAGLTTAGVMLSHPVAEKKAVFAAEARRELRRRFLLQKTAQKLF